MRSVHKLGQISAGQVLAADGLISPDQLDDLLVDHQESGERVTDIAIERDLVTEFDVAKAMVRHLQLPYVNPRVYDTPEEVRTALPEELLREARVVPVDRFGPVLVLATCGDLSREMLQLIEQQAGCGVLLYLSQKSDLEQILEERYPAPSLDEGMGQEVASRLDQLFGS